MKISEMYLLNRQGCNNFVLLSFFVVIALISSCTTPKKLVYFNDLKKDTLHPAVITMTETTTFKDPKIEPNDVLNVTIQTITQNESNAPTTTQAQGISTELSGFLVDKNGYIELSLIGFVKVAGLTTTEARELVKQKAKEFYKDPVVLLRIANFDVSVMGDVARPGKVTVPSEKATILDVLALSGDLNITARRDNVLLIRTEGNERKFVRFDLTSSSVFQSPYFYVKQRDQLYVEPNRSKVESADNRLIRNVGLFGTVLSIATALVIFRIIK
jgi:polysaccharide export outer membrane protein